jgi:hypothetical protein
VKAIKTIWKKIFPALLLKQAFLVFNKAKILTRDKVIFPEYEIAGHQFQVHRKGVCMDAA